MMKTSQLDHPSISEFLFDAACWLKHFIVEMPLAQGVIVMMAAGITLGTLSFNQIEVVAMIVRYLSAGMVVTLGLASLYMLSIDRRHPRKFMQFSILLLLTMNLSYFIPLAHEMYMIIHGLCISGLALMLFLISVRHNTHPTIEKERRNVRNSTHSAR
jgi:hypothetical protein